MGASWVVGMLLGILVVVITLVLEGEMWLWKRKGSSQGVGV